MRILIDTCVLIEAERLNRIVKELLQKLIQEEHELAVSTITVAELLTGVYQQKSLEAEETANAILNQFIWKDLTGDTAQVVANLSSNLLTKKFFDSIDYQDIIIGATAIQYKSDYLLTLNIKDFSLLPGVRAITPQQLLTLLKK